MSTTARSILWGSLAGTAIAALSAVALVLCLSGPLPGGDRGAAETGDPRRLIGSVDAGAGPGATALGTAGGRSAGTKPGRRTLRRGGDAASSGAGDGDVASRDPLDPRTPGGRERGMGAAGASESGDPAAGDAEGAGGAREAAASLARSRAERSSEADERGDAQPEALDADLQVLRQLGVDLDHPEAEMLRLAAEYRGFLLASAAGEAVADPVRMALLDQGMAALLRVRPASTASVFQLLDGDPEAAPQRYFAFLIRGGSREPYESSLGSTAIVDPNPMRRASAVLALGPVPAGGTVSPLLSALADPQVEVRQAAATVVSEAARTSPAWMAREDVRDAVRQALLSERDPAIRTSLLRAFVGSAGAASGADLAFLARLPEVDADPRFREAWAEAMGMR